nr:hypothetical protein Q903MT_gene4640 [Picea sitchensis]
MRIGYLGSLVKTITLQKIGINMCDQSKYMRQLSSFVKANINASSFFRTNQSIKLCQVSI